MLNVYIPYDTISRGSVATSRAMPTPFYLSIMKLVSFGTSGFMYNIMTLSLIIGSCTLENINS